MEKRREMTMDANDARPPAEDLMPDAAPIKAAEATVEAAAEAEPTPAIVEAEEAILRKVEAMIDKGRHVCRVSTELKIARLDLQGKHDHDIVRVKLGDIEIPIEAGNLLELKREELKNAYGELAYESL